jgi:cyanobactin biosynthesis protein (PatB/AcyB/McaB family)
MNTAPPIAQPVRRAGLFRDQDFHRYEQIRQDPPELIQPFRTVDFHGQAQQITDVMMKLIHGANYNNPQRFFSRNYNQLKSSQFLSSTSFGKIGMGMATGQQRINRR